MDNLWAPDYLRISCRYSRIDVSKLIMEFLFHLVDRYSLTQLEQKQMNAQCLLIYLLNILPAQYIFGD